MPIDFNKETPRTFEEAVQRIYDGLDEKEIEAFKAESALAVKCHFGVGMSIRNNWGLWSGGPLCKDFKTRFGLGHADDMSGMVLDAVQAKVCGLPFEPNNKAAEAIDFWKKAGHDPLNPAIDEQNALRKSDKIAGRDLWKWLGIKET